MTPIVAAAALLLLGAALAVLLPGNRARAWAALVTQAVATLLVELAVVPVLAGGPALRHVEALAAPVGDLVLCIDPLGAFFLSWSLPMTLLGSLYALGYLAQDFGKDRHVGLHYALLNLTSLAFVLVYSIQNGLVFFFGWELAALAAWLGVIWDYPNQKVRFAGFNYLVSTHLSLLFLVAAFMVMHARTGTFDFAGFARFLSAPGPARAVVFALLLAAFGLKSAFFPFHTWLPRAHAAAPAHISALMSGVIHKAGLFGLLRFLLLLDRPEPWMGWGLIGFSLCSAVIGALYTVTQRDLKRLLGYSSTENVGLCGVGFGLGILGLCWGAPTLVALGFTGGLLHAINHALFKCLLFYGAGGVYRIAHTVDLERLGGLIKVAPRLSAAFLVGAVAICGLPPLNGFTSELCLYAGLLGPGAPVGAPRAALIAVAAALALVGALSALSMTRCFGVAFLGSPRDPKVHAGGEPAGVLQGVLLVHALGCALLGLCPAVGLLWVSAPAGLFLARAGDAAALAGIAPRLLAPASWLAVAVVGTALAVALLRRALVPSHALHVTWGCGYTAPSPRMQYTGSSFSDQLASLLPAVLPVLRRERRPARDQVFPPAGDWHLQTHSVDAVERRMFEVIGSGQATADRVSARNPDDPGLSFALGIAALILGAAAVLSQAPAGGPRAAAPPAHPAPAAPGERQER